MRLWLCGVALLLGLLGGSVADAATSASPWDGPAAVRSLEGMFEDPRFRRSLAEGRSRHVALEARRASSAARAQRLASRSAFTDLSRSESLALARQQFPELMTGDLGPLELPAGDRVVDFRAANVAQVVDANGDESLVIGTRPFATRQDGQLVAIDLDLQATDSGFAPERPAVAVSLPDTAAGLLRLQSAHVGVGAAGARAVVGSMVDDRVFYPDVLTDTDFAATPTPAGVEFMWQLRSADAPEVLGVDVELPAGASMRLASDLTANGSSGAVEIVGDAGVLSTISAPVAVDADGVAVPASFRFDGGELVVDVAHRGADVQYPVLVDPEVRDVWGSPDFAYNCGGGPTNFAPGLWTYQQWFSPFSPICGNADGWGNGLFVRSEAMTYYDASRAEWVWSPPAGSYIMSVWFDGMRHLAAGTHMFTGLWGQTWGSLARHYTEFTYGQYSHAPDSPYNSWAAIAGLWMDGTYYRPHIGLAAVRGVNIRLGDLDSPVVWDTSVNPGALNAQRQTRWIDPNQTTPWVTVRAIDGGLGLRNIGVVRDVDRRQYGGIQDTCAGHRSQPCLKDREVAFTIPNSIPEGVTAVQAWASDVVDNSGFGPYFYTRIDRTAPEIWLAGDLFHHATDGTLGADPEIHIYSTDGTTSQARLGGSGVKRVRLMVDGIVVHDYSAPESTCDNCDRDLRWSLPGLLLGMHTVTIEAWDYLGHRAEQNFQAGLELTYADAEIEYSPETPATQTEAQLDPSWDGGATASAPRTCRWLFNKAWWNAGVFRRALWVSLRSRYCWNRTAHTAWSNGDWLIAEDGSNLGGTVSLQSLELGDKPVYHVTHHGYPRGGVHMGVKWRARMCFPIGGICTTRPWQELVNYGYYDGNGFADRST